jgi:hypothetical protein
MVLITLILFFCVAVIPDSNEKLKMPYYKWLANLVQIVLNTATKWALMSPLKP